MLEGKDPAGYAAEKKVKILKGTIATKCGLHGIREGTKSIQGKGQK